MTIRVHWRKTRILPLVLRGISVFTLAAGLMLLAYPAFVYIESEYTQWAGGRQLAAAVQAAEAEKSKPPSDARETVVPKSALPASTQPAPPPGSVLAKFEIPRLKISYVLLEGTDHETLDKSIGHAEGTGLPGSDGNIGIAGHRNTHFRRLEWVRRGDDLLLTTPQGTFKYKVEWIRLFTPSDLYVLDPSHGPAVTLVTCFPFEYVGNAPMRFIVRALPDEETRAKLTPEPKPTKGE